MKIFYDICLNLLDMTPKNTGNKGKIEKVKLHQANKENI